MKWWKWLSIRCLFKMSKRISREITMHKFNDIDSLFSKYGRKSFTPECIRFEHQLNKSNFNSFIKLNLSKFCDFNFWFHVHALQFSSLQWTNKPGFLVSWNPFNCQSGFIWTLMFQLIRIKLSFRYGLTKRLWPIQMICNQWKLSFFDCCLLLTKRLKIL